MRDVHRVAILLSDPAYAEAVARLLEGHSYSTTIAKGVDDLSRQLVDEQVDVLVLENDLGGFFSGLDILDRVCIQLTRPLLVLIAEDSTAVRAESQRLGIDAILRPPANPQEVVDAIAGVLAASQLGNLEVTVPLRARQLVHHVPGIAPLPQLLAKVSRYLQLDTGSVRELAQDISVDAKVCAELLRLANSSASAVRTRVTTVFEAVNLLGVQRTVSLVLSTAVVDRQRALVTALPDSLRTWYNRRSVLIAATASTFAERVERVSPEVAFLLGVFQDLGTLLLAAAYGEKYASLVDRVSRIGQLTLDRLELDQWGMTHADVSAALLQAWQVPVALVTPVFYHHDIDGFSKRPQVEQGYLHAMSVAEAFANMIDGYTPHKLARLNRLMTSFIGSMTQMDHFQAVLAESVGKALEASQLFAVPIPSPDAFRQVAGEVCRELGSGRMCDGPQQTRPHVTAV